MRRETYPPLWTNGKLLSFAVAIASLPGGGGRGTKVSVAKREAARDLSRQVATILDDVTGAREERIKKRLGRYPVSPGTFEQLTRS